MLRLPLRAVERLTTIFLFISCLTITVNAHEHHEDNIPAGEYVSPEPLVRGFS